MMKMKVCLSVALLAALLCACNASNCPLETTVTCNYGFYDSDGTAVSYGDTITVSTLLPGVKTQYTYRKLGSTTYVLDYQDSSLINAGYTESQAVVRRDTVLANKLIGATSMSLPMKYFSESDTLIFSYASLSSKDTLYVAHESYSHVDLPECGTHRFHTLKNVRATEAAIDRVEIVDASVNFDGNENVKIYWNGTVE